MKKRTLLNELISMILRSTLFIPFRETVPRCVLRMAQSKRERFAQTSALPSRLMVYKTQPHSIQPSRFAGTYLYINLAPFRLPRDPTGGIGWEKSPGSGRGAGIFDEGSHRRSYHRGNLDRRCDEGSTGHPSAGKRRSAWPWRTRRKSVPPVSSKIYSIVVFQRWNTI